MAGYHPDYFSSMLTGKEIADKAIEKIAAILGVSKELLLSKEPLEYGKLPDGFGALNDPHPDELRIRELEAREAQLVEDNKRLLGELQRERSMNDGLLKALTKAIDDDPPTEP